MISWRILLLALLVSLASAALPVQAQKMTDNLAAQRMAEDPDLAFARASSGIELKTQFMQETWWRDGEDWSVDLEQGQINFRNARGWQITAPVQVVGTYNTQDGTFLWGWDHPSVPPASATAAQLVHDYGTRHGLEILTTRMVTISEDEAWELSALADYLSEGQGVYRGPVGTTLVYMTFGEITISQP